MTMKEKKFECKQCGLCCKKFEESQKGGIRLFEFERDKFMNLAEGKGIKEGIFIRRLGEQGVGVYGVRFNEGCPFLENNKCSIYNDRPFYCRTFPIHSLSINKNNLDIIFDYLCPESKIKKRTNGKINLSEKFKELYEIYGDIFLIALEMDFINNKFIELSGKFNYNFEKPFFKQVIKNGILDEEELKILIMEIYELKHARVVVNELFKREGWSLRV
jgi:Fe-S-cluster containining protein